MTTSAFGASTGATGILHPKLISRFVVRFNCVYSGSNVSEAEEHLRILSLQTISVDAMPSETFGVPVRVKRAKAPLIDVVTEGTLSITFQDDLLNKLQAALDFLTGSEVSHVKIVVAKLDGNESILESHVYGQVQLKKVQHSVLNYSGTQGGYGSFSGKMTDKSQDHIDINGAISTGTGAVTKTLTVLPTWSMRSGSVKNMNTLLAI